MDLKPLKSSNIAAAGHDPDNQRLRIKFHSGHTHDFVGVPESTYQELISADSPGRYFHQEIRPRFTGQKVEQPDQPIRDTGSAPLPEQPSSLDEAVNRFTAGAQRP